MEREYQQHRNLGYDLLPETFAEWRKMASARAEHFARARSERVVKVIIHPRELDEWAQQTGRVVDDKARSVFARMLWQAEAERWLQIERLPRVRVTDAQIHR